MLPRPALRIPIAPHLALETTQLHQAADLLAVVNANRDYLKKWLPWAHHMHTVQQYEQYITSVKKGRRSREQFGYHISFEGKIIGRAALLRFDYPNKKTEIGYWLSAEYQGKGIASRATSALIDVAIHTLGMHRIEIRCAVGNDASSAIPKRLGFSFEGVARQWENAGDYFRDVQMFAILATEWPIRSVGGCEGESV